ncbi:MAG: hypothetical protein WCV86_02960 [Patescibacteria group bacterium]|jgi:hypothetical protein
MPRISKNIFSAFLIFGAFVIPQAVFAHALWFVEEPIATDGSAHYVLWGGAVVAAVLLIFLRNLSARPVGGTPVKVLHLQVMPFVGLAKNILSIGSGVALLLFASRGELFSPDLVATTGLDELIRIFMLIAGLGFIVLVFKRYAAVSLLIALILLWFRFGVVTLLAHAEYIGLALAFLLSYAQGKFLLRFAMRYVRIGLGVALLVAAFQEKLVEPGIALAFLQTHDWNFVAQFGISDAAFVYLAGVSEAFIGLLFILNIFPRFAGLAVLGLFTLTFSLLGVNELIGHIVAGLIALFVALYGTDYFHFTEEQEIEL